MSNLVIVGYGRVSTDKIEQENSLINQKEYFATEIIKAGNIHLDTYLDEGLTGTKLNNRKEFNRMLNDAGLDIKEFYSSRNDRRVTKKHTVFEISDRVPLFNEIWIKNTSRFARNTLSFDIIAKLRQKGVNIFFIEQNINTNDVGQDLLLKLLQVFDEQDSKDKSSKVRWGIQQSAKRGAIHTNSKLYGYNFVEAEKRLEINENEAMVVQQIFKLYSEGLGIRQIINILDEQGFKGKLSGKRFSNSTIGRILDNEKYYGVSNRNKYDTGVVFSKNSYAKVRDYNEYELVETDKIPTIISKEIFEECREIRRSKVSYTSQKGIYKGITDYAGLIKCGNCGSSYSSNSDKSNNKNRHFYNCSMKKKRGITFCSNPNIPKSKLDNAIEFECNEGYKDFITSLKKANTNIFENLKKHIAKQLDTDKTDKVKQYQGELIELYEEQKQLGILFLKKKINEDVLDELQNELSSKIEKALYEIAENSKGNDEIMKDITEVDSTIEDINSMPVKDVYTKDEILDSIETIFIGSKGYIEISYKVAKTINALASKYEIAMDFFEEYYSDTVEGLYGDEFEVSMDL